MDDLLARLLRDRKLERAQWQALLEEKDRLDRPALFALAAAERRRWYGDAVYVRGLIECTNYCKNNCCYCGIRRGNEKAVRYRLTPEEILECCQEGYALGYRTFVLQGGEDGWWTDQRLSALVSVIRETFPDCAVTLSVGERSRESYQRLFDAGAERYLLRHETISEAHYGRLHPPELSWKNRMRCLRDLKEIGYQTGCGCMVGTPGQTPEMLAEEMQFLTAFRPQMIGLGPFLPHKDTPFRGEKPGSPETTLFLLSLCRLALPDVLLPSTTALGTARDDGRALGVLAGANVIMPNLSPRSVREKYMLYDNKAGTALDARAGLETLGRQMEAIGYRLVSARGDYRERDREEKRP